jgi:hypothetical protein
VKVKDEEMDALSTYEGINVSKDSQLKKAVEELNKIIK